MAGVVASKVRRKRGEEEQEKQLKQIKVRGLPRCSGSCVPSPNISISGMGACEAIAKVPLYSSIFGKTPKRAIT